MHSAAVNNPTQNVITLSYVCNTIPISVKWRIVGPMQANPIQSFPICFCKIQLSERNWDNMETIWDNIHSMFLLIRGYLHICTFSLLLMSMTLDNFNGYYGTLFQYNYMHLSEPTMKNLNEDRLSLDNLPG